MMSLIEDVLTQTIESRLKWLKTNVDILDRIFSQASITTRNRLKEYVKNNNIRVLRGFPADRTSLPCYVIMLGGEQEQTQNLGGYIGDDDESYELGNTTENLRIMRHDGMYVVKTSQKPIFSINHIIYDGITYDVDFEVLDYNRGLVMLDFPVDLVNESTLDIDYTFKESGTETYGSFFHTQYRVETWTNNGDLTVSLYHLLKWIMLSSRDDLSSQGLVVQNLGGLDFEPAPEYFPEFVYRRALTFDCTTESSYDVQFTYIDSINVNGDTDE